MFPRGVGAGPPHPSHLLEWRFYNQERPGEAGPGASEFLLTQCVALLIQLPRHQWPQVHFVERSQPQGVVPLALRTHCGDTDGAAFQRPCGISASDTHRTRQTSDSTWRLVPRRTSHQRRVQGALFPTVPQWEQPRCPPGGAWVPGCSKFIAGTLLPSS